MMTESPYDDISVPDEPSDVTQLTAGVCSIPHTPFFHCASHSITLLVLTPQNEQSQTRYMITVANPQKVGTKGAYVAYEVRSRCTGGSGDSYTVVRRFSDFLWLHDELQRHNPSLVIPPMPEKALSLSCSPHRIIPELN